MKKMIGMMKTQIFKRETIPMKAMKLKTPINIHRN
jgi:hypothetical protein